MKVLKAFTILEVLIVVLLTALIVLMSMSVIQIVNQQFTDYAEDHRQSERLRLFQVLLEADFLNSEYAMVYEDALEFQHHNHQVNYQFEPDFIIRTLIKKTVHRDTFYLLTRQKRALFQKELRDKGWRRRTMANGFSQKIQCLRLNEENVCQLKLSNINSKRKELLRTRPPRSLAIGKAF